MRFHFSERDASLGRSLVLGRGSGIRPLLPLPLAVLPRHGLNLRPALAPLLPLLPRCRRALLRREERLPAPHERAELGRRARLRVQLREQPLVAAEAAREERAARGAQAQVAHGEEVARVEGLRGLGLRVAQRDAHDAPRERVGRDRGCDGDEVCARGVVGDVDVARLFGGDVDDLRGKGGWVSWGCERREGVNVPRPCR